MNYSAQEVLALEAIELLAAKSRSIYSAPAPLAATVKHTVYQPQRATRSQLALRAVGSLAATTILFSAVVFGMTSGAGSTSGDATLAQTGIARIAHVA